jgi:hypothetical protein
LLTSLNAYAALDQAGNTEPVLTSATMFFKQSLENSTGQFYTDLEIPSAHSVELGTASVPPVALNTGFNRSKAMNIFYIIGVVVVVIVVAGYFGLHL